MFSISQEERSKVCLELFSRNGSNILKALDGAPPQILLSSKKCLKIDGQTINNYIKIIFNKTLEEHIQLSAAQQLIESIVRIELNQQIIGILVVLSMTIKEMFEKAKQSLNVNLISILIQIKELIDYRTNMNNPFSLPTLGMLLEE